jgi:hypothetical protein
MTCSSEIVQQFLNKYSTYQLLEQTRVNSKHCILSCIIFIIKGWLVIVLSPLTHLNIPRKSFFYSVHFRSLLSCSYAFLSTRDNVLSHGLQGCVTVSTVNRRHQRWSQLLATPGGCPCSSGNSRYRIIVTPVISFDFYGAKAGCHCFI